MDNESTLAVGPALQVVNSAPQSVQNFLCYAQSQVHSDTKLSKVRKFYIQNILIFKFSGDLELKLEYFLDLNFLTKILNLHHCVRLYLVPMWSLETPMPARNKRPVKLRLYLHPLQTLFCHSIAATYFTETDLLASIKLGLFGDATKQIFHRQFHSIE